MSGGWEGGWRAVRKEVWASSLAAARGVHRARKRETDTEPGHAADVCCMREAGMGALLP